MILAENQNNLRIVNTSISLKARGIFQVQVVFVISQSCYGVQY